MTVREMKDAKAQPRATSRNRECVEGGWRPGRLHASRRGAREGAHVGIADAGGERGQRRMDDPFDSYSKFYIFVHLRLDKKLSKDNNENLDNRKLQPENNLSAGVRPLISEGLDGPPSSSQPSSSGQGFKSPETPDSTISVKPSVMEPMTSSRRPGSSTSSTSERIAANSVASTPGLSPSSSIGSLTSEKSTLNPNAKEFKLNPNAKSFTPSVSLRPPNPPASDASYYYPNNMPAAPLGPGLPVGMTFPPAYGGQPVMYNPQPGTPPQGYMHPAGPQYGQQQMMGQTRPVYYFAPEMQQYRGRNF
nr:unnamed protein product [Digitaria exilis]